MYLRALIPLCVAGRERRPGQPFVLAAAEAADYLAQGWAQPIHGAPPRELEEEEAALAASAAPRAGGGGVPSSPVPDAGGGEVASAAPPPPGGGGTGGEVEARTRKARAHAAPAAGADQE